MTILSIQNVSKNYGKKAVLNDVSLNIEEGDIFGLLGSNGAGKSTITKIILGLETASKGKVIYFEGKKINLKKKMALVPQDIACYKEFSVEKNMMFFASIAGLKGKAKKERVDFLINWLSLKEFEKTIVDFLSGGYQRLVNIAIALIQDPEIIFLDEPTVGLDPKMRKLFWNKIKELKQSGKTIILTTHYMDEAEELCTKIALLKKGKLLTVGKPGELIREHGGIKVMIFDVEGGVSEEHINKIKEVLNQKSVVMRGELLFIPLEQAHGLEKTLAVTQWLLDQGYKIKSSTTKEPNLEDVFMNITGEKMNEGNDIEEQKNNKINEPNTKNTINKSGEVNENELNKIGEGNETN
jgi:ABC-2 type transport system ATP-binding protein